MNAVAKNKIPHTLLCCLLAGLSLLGLIVFTWIALFPETNQEYGNIGSGDFIEYWSAYQLYQRQENPYNPQLLNEIQSKLGRHEKYPLMMWNPPWILTILSPILALDFSQAYLLWFACNIGFLLATALLLWIWTENCRKNRSGNLQTLSGAIGNRTINAACAISATVFFYPVYNTLYLGQSSLLITFGLVLCFWAIEQRRDWIAGPALILLTLKPHLLYLVLIALLWWIISSKRYAIILWFGISFSLLIASLFHQSSSALSYWIKSLDQSQANSSLIKITEWQTASLASFIREIISRGIINYFPDSLLWFGEYCMGLIFIIPSVCALAFSLYLMRTQARIDWFTWLPPLTCFSILLCPFSWVFDQSLTVVLQVSLILEIVQLRTHANRGRQVLISLLSLQLAYLLALQLGFSQHQHFFWPPGALLILWGLSRHQNKAQF